ncbi:MAG: hypothetical protein HQK53_18245 [Oligoflexia bacterium]|nr:hypothetical protein [Oligoflexia bacterium]
MDKKDVIKKIEELIVELKKTNNPTINYYEGIIVKLKSIDSKELQESLLNIASHSKIMDYGGYNGKEGQLWEEMSYLAEKLANTL